MRGRRSFATAFRRSCERQPAGGRAAGGPGRSPGSRDLLAALEPAGIGFQGQLSAPPSLFQTASLQGSPRQFGAPSADGQLRRASQSRWQVSEMFSAISRPLVPLASTQGRELLAATAVAAWPWGSRQPPRRVGPHRPPTTRGHPRLPRPTITIGAGDRKAGERPLGLVTSRWRSPECAQGPLTAAIAPQSASALSPAPGAAVAGVGPGTSVPPRARQSPADRRCCRPSPSRVLNVTESAPPRSPPANDPAGQLRDRAAGHWPPPLAGDLAHRAAHVDVDQEAPRLRRRALRPSPPDVMQRLHRDRAVSQLSLEFLAAMARSRLVA